MSTLLADASIDASIDALRQCECERGRAGLVRRDACRSAGIR